MNTLRRGFFVHDGQNYFFGEFRGVTDFLADVEDLIHEGYVTATNLTGNFVCVPIDKVSRFYLEEAAQ